MAGDSVAWPEFSDTFKVAIHENPDLTDIERFTYLKGYLLGEAANCIQGLPLTASNYLEALRLLGNRFGNKKLIISKHMMALLDLERVTSSHAVKDLRALYDKIMVNIRALQAYGVTSEQFGPMLSPVLMKMLPNDIMLEVNRRLKDRNLQDWFIEEMLDILRSEIETREACASNRNEEKTTREPKFPPRRDTRVSTETLHVGSRPPPRCVFCKGEHFSDKCRTVSDIKARLDIARKRKLCYKCLGQHMAKDCISNSKCFICKERSHHSALHREMEPRQQQQKQQQQTRREDIGVEQKVLDEEDSRGMLDGSPKAALMTVNKSPVFLQTIRVSVRNESGNSVMANIIFDGGSEKSYVTKILSDRLKLNPIGKQKMQINTFGEKKGKTISVAEVEFQIGNQCPPLCVRGFVVPTICAPLVNNRVNIPELKLGSIEVKNCLGRRDD